MSKSYPCTIDVANAKYYPTAVSFPFPKGSPYVELFSREILLLKQSGQIIKLIEKHLTSTSERISCDQSAYKVIPYTSNKCFSTTRQYHISGNQIWEHFHCFPASTLGCGSSLASCRSGEIEKIMLSCTVAPVRVCPHRHMAEEGSSQKRVKRCLGLLTFFYLAKFAFINVS